MKYKTDICEYCPRHLVYLPTEPCPVAIKTLEHISNGGLEEDNGMCPWYVPDVDSNYCFWMLFEREAPVEDTKELARLLGMTKKEVESLTESGLKKLHGLGPKAKVIVDWIDAMHECMKPVDDSIYLKLFDLDAYYDPDVDDDSSDKPDWNPEDLNEDYRQDTSEFKLADKVVPNKRKRREALKHITRGHSGAGAVHKSGKRIQLYSLSTKWHINAKKFADMGTPIKMATYTLEHIGNTHDNKDEPDKEDKQS